MQEVAQANLLVSWQEALAEVQVHPWATGGERSNWTFWEDDGYAGGTNKDAMIGGATTSATDVEHLLKLLDELRERHPLLLLRSSLDCGAGVECITKNVLLKQCDCVCLLKGCERWLKQTCWYLGKKHLQSCKFVLGQLDESATLEVCGMGGRCGQGGTLFNLIWVQWVSG